MPLRHRPVRIIIEIEFTNKMDCLTINTTLCILSRSEKYSIVSGSSLYKWFTAVVAWHPWAMTDPSGHFRNLIKSPRKEIDQEFDVETAP